MKIFKNSALQKKAQSVVEFALVAILVGIMSFVAFYKLNPAFFRSFFKGSVSASGNIDSNGQLTLNNYDDTSQMATSVTSPCDTTIAIGSAETDGTIYAGSNLCTTSADTGSATFNKGAHVTLSTTATSTSNGQSNTNTLAGLSDSASPYNAALMCANLTINGHSDWYLPAQSELLALYNNLYTAGKGSLSNNKYWSSTDDSSPNDDAMYVNFNNGGTTHQDKSTSSNVRCVRHD